MNYYIFALFSIFSLGAQSTEELTAHAIHTKFKELDRAAKQKRMPESLTLYFLHNFLNQPKSVTQNKTIRDTLCEMEFIGQQNYTINADTQVVYPYINDILRNKKYECRFREYTNMGKFYLTTSIYAALNNFYTDAKKGNLTAARALQLIEQAVNAKKGAKATVTIKEESTRKLFEPYHFTGGNTTELYPEVVEVLQPEDIQQLFTQDKKVDIQEMQGRILEIDLEKDTY